MLYALARLNKILLIILIMAGTTACTPPWLELDRKADHLGLERREIAGKRFEHVAYAKGGSPPDTLHIYLDGDGTPWLGGRPAVDPTPRDALVLRLAAMDPAPVVYLGRPCYHGRSDQACAPRFWTTQRYSEEVVASLAAAVRRLVADGGFRRIAWFGHSGGGTLATLLAPRFPETEAVVTVAANLDTAAWAAYAWQGESPGSLNPAMRGPLSADIRQRHYAGGTDRVVPPKVTRAGASALGGEIIVIADFDHVCCWERIWPDILAAMAR